MSAFLTKLTVTELDDSSNDGRGTWQLEAPLVYESDIAKKTITVPVGFVTDYASVPRLPIAYLLVGGIAHKAAVIHDWLYTSHEVDKATADLVLKEAVIVSGIAPWRASLIYSGVWIGGAGAYEADATKQPGLVKQVLDTYENSVNVPDHNSLA